LKINQGKANKGSRFWLQEFIMDQNKCDCLSNQIISTSASLLAFGVTDLRWKSPLVKDSFYEYRDDFLNALELDSQSKGKIKKARNNFWPKNGPQWDGIALTKSKEKGIVLVEAKSHLGETKSDMGASSKESISKIENAIQNVQSYMGVNVNTKAWTKKNYQLANRISYLYFLNNICELPTWLVLINFIRDTTNEPTELKEWIQHYNEIFEEMNINNNSMLLDRMIMVYPVVG